MSDQPHYITSRAELRRILEGVHSGEISINDAYGSIDLTIRCSNLAMADWLERSAKDIRTANPENPP